MRISDAGVNPRLLKILGDAGFETIEQISRANYSRVRGLRGIGDSAMDEIERSLAMRGLKMQNRPKERSDFYKQIGVYP